MNKRQAQLERVSRETRIKLALELDGTGLAQVNTGIGFLDHMLEQLSYHSLMNLTLQAEGDLEIDAHHTTEDSGIVLGQALDQALGSRQGVNRYGCACIPMDDALTRVAIDLSGRPYLAWRVKLERGSRLGTMDCELFQEWFTAFAFNAKAALHVDNLSGHNHHHIIESCFKALARALREAIAIDQRRVDAAPSTKGRLRE